MDPKVEALLKAHEARLVACEMAIHAIIDLHPEGSKLADTLTILSDGISQNVADPDTRIAFQRAMEQFVNRALP